MPKTDKTDDLDEGPDATQPLPPVDGKARRSWANPAADAAVAVSVADLKALLDAAGKHADDDQALAEAIGRFYT